jgi:hypothetical protein
VRLLEYNADQESLSSTGVWLHAPEVWDIATCPMATERMATVHSKGGYIGGVLSAGVCAVAGGWWGVGGC